MRIRDERPSDIASISTMITAAFAAAPHAQGDEAEIVDRLRAAGALTISLVADGAGHDHGATDVIGHVAFSPIALAGASDWYVLGPLAVRPERQGRGIGSGLVEAGLARLRAIGAHGCFLVGDPAYYTRFGFVSGAGMSPDLDDGSGGKPGAGAGGKPGAGAGGKPGAGVGGGPRIAGIGAEYLLSRTFVGETPDAEVVLHPAFGLTPPA